MANGYNDNGLVHHTNEGVEFHEDPTNGNHKALIQRPSALSNDVYLTLPTTSGQLSTETYVANSTGGAFVGLSSDYTDTGTSTADVTGLSFEVAANRAYAIEGCFIFIDPSDTTAGYATLSVPSGTTWDGYCQAVRTNSTPELGQWSDTASGFGGFTGQTGEFTNQDPNGNGKMPVFFRAMVLTSSTAGTVQVRFTNRTGNGSTVGLAAGSYIRITDPQG